MTREQLETIRQFDLRCGDNEGVLFPVTIDRRRLIEYVDELQSLVREAKILLTPRDAADAASHWLERTQQF